MDAAILFIFELQKQKMFFIMRKQNIGHNSIIPKKTTKYLSSKLP
jgi:hypothetical protein